MGQKSQAATIVFVPLMGLLFFFDTLLELFGPGIIPAYLLTLYFTFGATRHNGRSVLPGLALGWLAVVLVLTLACALIWAAATIFFVQIAVAAVLSGRFGAPLLFGSVAVFWLASTLAFVVALRGVWFDLWRADVSKAYWLVQIPAGMTLAIFVFWVTAKMEDRWLTPRVAAFDTDDVVGWEVALGEIRANPLCRHTRCLRWVCNKLETRYGSATGEPGHVWHVFPAFAYEAPDLPEHLDVFLRVYKRPARQVCARPD